MKEKQMRVSDKLKSPRVFRAISAPNPPIDGMQYRYWRNPMTISDEETLIIKEMKSYPQSI